MSKQQRDVEKDQPKKKEKQAGNDHENNQNKDEQKKVKGTAPPIDPRVRTFVPKAPFPQRLGQAKKSVQLDK